MSGGNGSDGYRTIWGVFEEAGYATRPFPPNGNHTELLSPDGKRIGIYNLPESLPEEVRCQILSEEAVKFLGKHSL